jgi:integral membrane protein
MLATPIARLRLIGLVESLSWFALLFIAVPMKRLPGLFGMDQGNDILVTIIGPIHGGLWCLYLLAIYLATRSPGLPRKVTVLALVCTFLPFPVPLLILDPKLKKLDPQSEPA